MWLLHLPWKLHLNVKTGWGGGGGGPQLLWWGRGQGCLPLHSSPCINREALWGRWFDTHTHSLEQTGISQLLLLRFIQQVRPSSTPQHPPAPARHQPVWVAVERQPPVRFSFQTPSQKDPVTAEDPPTRGWWCSWNQQLQNKRIQNLADYWRSIGRCRPLLLWDA